MNGEYPNYPREMVEEFEAQIAALTKERDEWKGEYFRRHKDVGDAIDRLAAPVIPAGWVMVPEELTQEMFESVPLLIQPQLAFIWKTLLAAAPKPEDV